MCDKSGLTGLYDKTRKIMLVCDRPETAAVWGFTLNENILDARIEKDVEEAVKVCMEWKPDLIAMDLQIQFDEILRHCNQIRKLCSIPLILFLPTYNEEHILALYGAGVSECVVKPLSPDVFHAKVLSWLRSTEMFFSTEIEDLCAGELTLLTNNNQVCLPSGQTVDLTKLEFRLLHLLMSRPGYVFDARRIVSTVWGIYGKEDTTMLKHVIYRLRRKIECNPSNPQYIQTAAGKGYYFKTGEATATQ